jgi:AraC family transcriptional activator of pobA
VAGRKWFGKMGFLPRLQWGVIVELITGWSKLNRSIEKMLELLTEENKMNDENAFHINEGLLKSLLSKIFQVSQPVIMKSAIKSDLYHSFTELLSITGGIKHKLSFYAEKLNTSPQNLNAVCRKAIKQTASDILSGFVLSEAKRLLLYTYNTISEIAFAMEFSDSSHFVIYFKKYVGSTPKTFRSENA